MSSLIAFAAVAVLFGVTPRPDVDPTLYRTAAPTLIKMLRSRDHLPPPGPGVIPTGLPVG